MSESFNLVWSVLAQAGPLIVGFTGFVAAFLAIRKLELEREKVRLEVEKLSIEIANLKEAGQLKKNVLQIATLEETLRFGKHRELKKSFTASNQLVLVTVAFAGVAWVASNQITSQASYVAGLESSNKAALEQNSKLNEQATQAASKASALQIERDQLLHDNAELRKENEELIRKQERKSSSPTPQGAHGTTQSEKEPTDQRNNPSPSVANEVARDCPTAMAAIRDRIIRAHDNLKLCAGANKCFDERGNMIPNALIHSATIRISLGKVSITPTEPTKGLNLDGLNLGDMTCNPFPLYYTVP